MSFPNVSGSLGVNDRRIEIVGMHRANDISTRKEGFELDLNVLPVPINSSPDEPTARAIGAELVKQANSQV